MSMLSAQVDELRSMAESVGLAMPQAATLMMEAADAIEGLREQAEDMDFQLDKWQTKAEYFKQLADLAEADNAKLREEFNKMDVWHSKELTAAMAENAKLLELVAELYQCSRQYGCDRCGYKDGCAMFDRMAQMGVEVEHE